MAQPLGSMCAILCKSRWASAKGCATFASTGPLFSEWSRAQASVCATLSSISTPFASKCDTSSKRMGCQSEGARSRGSGCATPGERACPFADGVGRTVRRTSPERCRTGSMIERRPSVVTFGSVSRSMSWCALQRDRSARKGLPNCSPCHFAGSFGGA